MKAGHVWPLLYPWAAAAESFTAGEQGLLLESMWHGIRYMARNRRQRDLCLAIAPRD